MKKSASFKQQFMNSMTDISLRICIPLIILVIVGATLDDILHTRPLLLLTGVTLSLIISIFGIKQVINKIAKSNQERQ